MIIDTDIYRKNLLKYTRVAFSLLPEMDRPAILDAGCGTGVPTICLAQMSNGTVIGVDTDSIALEKLEVKIREMNLSPRITAVNCPIEKMPFEKRTFNIVWAEGSIAHIDFANALKVLGKYINAGGFLVIHDDAANYMKKIKSIEPSEFKIHGFFILPETIWWNEYYKHIETELKKIPSAQFPIELKALKQELERFKSNPKKYTSAFFIMKKN